MRKLNKLIVVLALMLLSAIGISLVLLHALIALVQWISQVS